MSKKEPYQNTDVSVSKSQEAVRKMLFDNGAIGYQFTEMHHPEPVIEMKWARLIIVDGNKITQPLRIRIPLKNRRIEQVYRALFYYLKTKFETVRFGIVSFEEEFLPFFEMRLASGECKTVAEMALPNLRKGMPPVIEPLCLPPGDGT
ncbi:MAG: hypothetical protein MUP55_01505 [Candidatus Aenigmarchaeota archaeon]|nr:hypothetical protein [Candidatus Aenigmarchaeota archaeon]